MLTHPATLYWHQADQLCFAFGTSCWVACKHQLLPVFGMTLVDPLPSRNQTHKTPWSMLGPPYHRLSQSAEATEGVHQGAPSGAHTQDNHVFFLSPGSSSMLTWPLNSTGQQGRFLNSTCDMGLSTWDKILSTWNGPFLKFDVRH